MNREKIYEIFRACRLCGVGAGYKMPIIQNIIDIENEEIELRQKIKECVQIEVNLNDPMPPLICELCVDKIQDFYEFRKMCHEINNKTRQRLGLPVKTTKGLESDSNLGVREGLNTDSDDGEPLAKQQPPKKPKPKSAKNRREDGVQNKLETQNERSRSSSVDVSERNSKGQYKRAPRRSELEELQDLTSHASTSTRLRQAPKTLQINLDRDVSDCESDTSNSTRSKAVPTSAKRKLKKDISDAESVDENSLLRAKRMREVPLEVTSIKKSRTSVEPPKTEKSKKAAPKSSKETAVPVQTPKPGPKSRKLDTTPLSQKLDMTKSKADEAKARKVEALETKSKSKAKAGPKSRMQEPVAPQKNKKVENVVTTASKGKKRDETSPAPPKPDAPAVFECDICGTKVKSAQGLASHCKVHMVIFTPPELACNACELWFPSNTAMGMHHKQHTNGYPYTCTKCYDDFRTKAEYEMHFTRKQCIPTYEVPDVKCESCWKTYPTYKLLEEHKCAGEGGRPGGKCSACKRVYATLKSLTTHEFRCTQKRKAEPKPPPDPEPEPAPKPEATPLETPQDMLPMQVRIVKCDSLLDIYDGQCDVSGISYRFGLDRRSRYPYLYSSGNLKSEPSTSSDHMVAINDDIKEEYLKDEPTEDSFTHWDSDSECNSDTDDISSTKSVRSLSNISLKTLFSPKCLGKVRKEQRKVQPESDSVLNINLKHINSIIDNLGHESNHSGDYDSDSILDKNLVKKDSVSDSVKDNDTHNMDTDDGIEETNRSGEEVDRIEDHEENTSDTEEMVGKETSVNEGPEESCESKDNRQEISNEEASESLQEEISQTEHLTESELLQNTNDNIELKENSEETAITPVESSSECKTSPENGHLVSDEIVSDDKNLAAENNETVTELQNADIEMTDRQESKNNANKLDGSDTDSQLSETNEQTNVTNSKNVENPKNLPEEKDENDDSNLDTNDKGEEKDDASVNNENDFTSVNDSENVNSSDATDVKVDENDPLNSPDNKTHYEETKNDAAETESNISQEDDIHKESDRNVNSGEMLTENAANEELSNSNDGMNIDKTSGEHLITESDLSIPKSIQSVDKFNINNLDEDEKRLMAELDAQIGEDLPESFNSVSDSRKDNSDDFGANNISNYNSEVGENSNNLNKNSDSDYKNASEYCENNSFTNNDFTISNKGFEEDKSETLDVLLKKGDDLKSLDLDSISDEEFNFDI